MWRIVEADAEEVSKGRVVGLQALFFVEVVLVEVGFEALGERAQDLNSLIIGLVPALPIRDPLLDEAFRAVCLVAAAEGITRALDHIARAGLKVGIWLIGDCFGRLRYTFLLYRIRPSED